MTDPGPRPGADIDAVAPPPERWAFESRTVQRIIVAGIMFWLSRTEYAAFVDQQLVADTVQMLANFVGFAADNINDAFAGLGTAALIGAGRARQVAGPERLYWLPRTRDQRELIPATA